MKNKKFRKRHAMIKEMCATYIFSPYYHAFNHSNPAGVHSTCGGGGGLFVGDQNFFFFFMYIHKLTWKIFFGIRCN